MAAFADLVRFIPTLGGTTDWIYSSAVGGCQSPALAGVTNSVKYKTYAISTDLTQWELSEGAYNSGTTTFPRTTVLYNSSGTGTATGQSGAGTKINFSTVPQVSVVALAEDIISVETANVFTAAQQAQVRANAGVPGLNILINPDFRINQMAYVSAATLASGVYGHDQWKGGASGGDYSFTQLGSSTQITIAASKSLIQVIEDKNVVGGSYVLSWTGSAQARYAINSTVPGGSYASSPILIAGQTAGTVMSVEFNTGTLGTVKLESGTIATPFLMRMFDEEINRCFRYFEAVGGDDANQTFGISACTSTTQSLGSFQFLPKRAVPTITASAAGDFINTSSGNGSLTCTAISFDQASKTSARIVSTVASGLVAGNATRLVANATTNARIKIDARV